MDRSIYTSEETDEVKEVSQHPDIEGLKRKKLTKAIPEKKMKPVPFQSSRQPIQTKRKVMKTRTYLENGRLVTEDYSSEEDYIITPTIAPIGKNTGKQMTINFPLINY